MVTISANCTMQLEWAVWAPLIIHNASVAACMFGLLCCSLVGVVLKWPSAVYVLLPLGFD